MLASYRKFTFRISATVVLASFLAIVSSMPATAVVFTPTADGIVRDGLDSPKDGVPDNVLEGSVVQVLDVDRAIRPFEDRGIIEFEISSIRSTPVNLVLTTFSSVGPFPFTVDVFSYAGDGFLTLTDFNSGSLFTSFLYSGESNISLDVSTVIQDLLSSNEDFAGFNFQFSIPTTIPGNGPFVAFNSLEFGPPAKLVTAILEPTTLTLFGIGLFALFFTERLRRISARTSDGKTIMRG